MTVPAASPVEARAWDALQGVEDPEIPQLSIVDLGIVRDVRVSQGADGAARVEADLTPTYSGCPAVSVIELDAETALRAAGFAEVAVRRVMAPAWTTDWITDRGRQKLIEAGIAPPVAGSSNKLAILGLADPEVSCPHCGSTHTRKISEFGSTACKALWRCDACLEPFDYFKCI